MNDALATEVVEHLQALVRFDTTNPPGNEAPAAAYVAGVLRVEGIAAEVVEPAPGRGSVVARLAAGRQAESAPEPALLLHAHLDVVPARAADGWTHDPFSGDLADGCVWGRGAIDDKAGVATLLAAFLALRRSGMPLRRDVILAATADEEAGGHMGAGWLVDHCPDLIDATYCIGEGGGYATYFGARRVYPCSVAEKGSCTVRVRARGPSGHAFIPLPDSAILTLSAALRRLSRPLPAHRVAAVEGFVDGVARAVGGPRGVALRAIGRSRWGARLVALAAARATGELGAQARHLSALLRNTAVPTMLEAGLRDNVISAEATAALDGRLLPGQTVELFLTELRAALGPRLTGRVDLEAVNVTPPVEGAWASPLADALCAAVARHDAGAPVIPFMLGAGTDAKHLTRLPSLQHYYGFTPLRAPRAFPLAELLHAVDERVPVEGLAFAAHVLADALIAFCGRVA
jgi:acetylornithine deacetylase/succinyl-diaminopimelate desuccinylase-like protein